VSTFVFAAFVAKRPGPHARLILDAYLWAAIIAASAGIAGYFDIVPGAFDLMTRYGRATGLFKDPNVFGPFLAPAFVYLLSRLVTGRLRQAVLPTALLLVLGLAVLLSFSRGAWANLGVAVALYGTLHLQTAGTNRARLKFATLGLLGMAALAALIVIALQFDEISNPFAERAALTHSYDEGPEGRFGGQEKAARLAVQNPFGIGAQQFVPHYHHEEPHNVYLAMFLNAGWLGGLMFVALIATTALHGLRHAFVRTAAQPLFLVVYACFIGHVLEGLVIDLDHWRHFYLLLALVWGLMLAPRSTRSIVIPAAAR
jgi:O-antigen ligase